MKKTTFIFIAIFVFLTILKVQIGAHEFKVGGDKGWVVPPSNDINHFDHWASRNRFSVNDTLRFVYEKDDSVLVVTKEEHARCRSMKNAMFVSFDGDTKYVLNRSGFFYFMGADASHCEHGLKMIVKVLEGEKGADQTANQTSSAKSEAASVLKMDSDTLSQTLMIVGIIAMFTVFYM